MTNAIDPEHYTTTKVEPIEVIDAWLSEDFMLGSVIKYVSRCKHSGKKQDDLIKAANYAFRAATGKWLPKKVVEDALANPNPGSPGRKRQG
jgi:hypothetical protein